MLPPPPLGRLLRDFGVISLLLSTTGVKLSALFVHTKSSPCADEDIPRGLIPAHSSTCPTLPNVPGMLMRGVSFRSLPRLPVWSRDTLGVCEVSAAAAPRPTTASVSAISEKSHEGSQFFSVSAGGAAARCIRASRCAYRAVLYFVMYVCRPSNINCQN